MTYYLIIVNIFSFVLFYIDKQKAIRNQYRISEKFFFTLSFLGGFIGLFISGKIFRHKTKKLSFYIVYGLSFILWLYIAKEVLR